MKLKLTLLSLLLCLMINAQKVKDNAPHFSLYDAGIFDGRSYYSGFGFGRPSTMQGFLPASSQIYAFDTDQMHDVGYYNSDWVGNSSNFGIGAFATFRLYNGNPNEKGSHLFSIGLNYIVGGVIDKQRAETNPYRLDTIVGPGPTDYAYIDSVTSRSYYISGTHNKLLVNFDYQYSSNQTSKFSISAGFGLGLGMTVSNYYYATGYNGYSKYIVNANAGLAPYPYDYDNLYYNTIKVAQATVPVFTEEAKTRSAFVLRPYIPISLSYRLSKSRTFLKNLNLFIMLKGGIEYLAWGKGTFTNSLFYEKNIGLRYRINLPNKKILKAD